MFMLSQVYRNNLKRAGDLALLCMACIGVTAELYRFWWYTGGLWAGDATAFAGVGIIAVGAIKYATHAQ